MHLLTPLVLLALTGAASAGAADMQFAQAARPAPAAPQGGANQGGANQGAAQAPKSIGTFGDWQAATHQEAGQLVCYAFTRASASTPAVPGRGDVILTVTHRVGVRGAVAIGAGFAYPASTDVTVQVDKAELAFYTAGRSAFATEGKAAIDAFTRGTTAVARSPGPRGSRVQDTFSLRGFTASYEAINKACPAR